MRSLVSWGLLGSSPSAVAFTRGGRPGGRVTGKAGAGLEVRVTGTTATGAIGARAAAMGTSGLTSEGSVSDEVGEAEDEEALDWSAAVDATEGSRAAAALALALAASGSAADSANPFRALGAGDAARVRGASERVFSTTGV